jgi:hypothetical protein
MFCAIRFAIDSDIAKVEIANEAAIIIGIEG